MFLPNQHRDYLMPLDRADAENLDMRAAQEVERYLTHRDNHAPTPLHTLPALAAELGVGAIHIKDEGFRLGLGSFKALGGSYAVIRLVLEEASRRLRRPIDVAELHSPEVGAIVAGMTVACATDGNHGRSVAQGAQLVGAKASIFVHSGVSDERVAAIARSGAQMIRVEGTYDDSVAEAALVAAEKGWIVVSDTSWPGYERIPGLVMQGYTAMVREALRQLPEPPTHVFVQAGVGGVAAAVAGYLALALGYQRPTFVVVDPARAACLFESARAGHPVKIGRGEPTVMAMLECYEPSLVAWRVLSRVADAFMTVDEGDAVAVMNRLARPAGNDPAIVAGESGGAGLAGFVRAAADPEIRAALGLNGASRVFVINTEGATDPERYAELVGMRPDAILADVAYRIEAVQNRGTPFKGCASSVTVGSSGSQDRSRRLIRNTHRY
jgi:diaminopropionate ammonia-lyase